jgi:plastocyanin
MAPSRRRVLFARPYSRAASRSARRWAWSLALAVGVFGAAAWPGTAATSGPAGPPSPQAATGTIEGRLILSEGRSRLARASYAVGGGARRVEPLPAVAMLVGRVAAGASAAPSREVGEVRVVQRDTAFAPGVVVVSRGTEVAFPNEDPFFHNVFSYSRPKRFDLGRYPRGESKSVTFDSPGIVQVFCEIHDWMRSAVVVTENPYHALVSEDGSFTIRDVPAGRYELRIWHFDRGDKTVDVEVPAQGTVRVEVSL